MDSFVDDPAEIGAGSPQAACGDPMSATRTAAEANAYSGLPRCRHREPKLETDRLLMGRPGSTLSLEDNTGQRAESPKVDATVNEHPLDLKAPYSTNLELVGGLQKGNIHDIMLRSLVKR